MCVWGEVLGIHLEANGASARKSLGTTGVEQHLTNSVFNIQV